MSETFDAPDAEVPPDEEARELLETLVSTPSPTGEEEACAEALASFFERHGRESIRDTNS